mmetsp:Transcript_22832/g.29588  ORF Transcript_22832/g.29588 Transcript_22832/m.29588 type:complete len:321 (+) Transcript_22832:122-1084(+)|eukprot:CAMPEP_0197294380 /NCGR_PEP_ID=MMETSP0890-20130614/32223_1 /TAXON_ID=44058 ORGANISM="Aureoumbra lagunensis, Strain CCMP1510" /NCGR_SAMPLE_ID=MMETSP0890 /ASSEMBLY_ACC=CAM_ASM_000533 /LENGTH=320 /DNA_ID=CAMNT_0042769755 /DNA_START=65 /DNA_END=1027 /DNA_ORIENTATION=-
MVAKPKVEEGEETRRANVVLNAIEAKRITLLSKLVSKEGVDINMILTEEGETAAHVCVILCGALNDVGYETVLRLILRMGCDPSTRRLDGSTPAHLAARFELTSCLALLREFSGQLDLEDVEGYAPAHICAAWGKTASIKWLLTYGNVSVDRTHKNGMSLAMFAASAGHLETLKCLKELGAELSQPCFIEHDLIRAMRVQASIMAMACYEGRDEVVDWLENECGIGRHESQIVVTNIPIDDDFDDDELQDEGEGAAQNYDNHERGEQNHSTNANEWRQHIQTNEPIDNHRHIKNNLDSSQQSHQEDDQAVVTQENRHTEI